MDYAGRFVFQVYAPLALLAIYVLGSKENVARLISQFKLPTLLVRYSASLIALALLFPTFSPAVADFAIYYSRLQAVHGELGRVAKELHRTGEVNATAVGDAGLFAFESGIPNLDIRKLGTHLGAINGVDRSLVELYAVDFAIIDDYSVADSVLRPYVLRENLVHVCDAHLSPTYVLEIWARKADSRLQKVCLNSSRYDSQEQDFSHLTQAPWFDWR
jgi:hypothetical protein